MALQLPAWVMDLLWVLWAAQGALWSLWSLFGLAEGTDGRHGSGAAVFALAGKREGVMCWGVLI